MKTMKYILILMIFSMVYGCTHAPKKSQTDIVNEMKCPVILMADSPETSSHYGRIILIDGDNVMSTMKTSDSFARIISEKYEEGDTIKKCTDNQINSDNPKQTKHKFVE